MCNYSHCPFFLTELKKLKVSTGTNRRADDEQSSVAQPWDSFLSKVTKNLILKRMSQPLEFTGLIGSSEARMQFEGALITNQPLQFDPALESESD